MSDTATYTHRFAMEVDIDFDGEQLAGLFWELSSSEQAGFFNFLGNKKGLAMQMQYVTEDFTLDSDGRYCMSLIGNYADKQKAE